jgi:putative ATPase
VLAQVVIALALAPKSNAVLLAVDEAVADVHRLGGGAVPLHLRGAGYVYPHDDPRGVVAADYLPDLLSHADYYRPVGRGGEAALRQRWENLRAIIRRTETQE